MTVHSDQFLLDALWIAEDKFLWIDSEDIDQTLCNAQAGLSLWVHMSYGTLFQVHALNNR